MNVDTRIFLLALLLPWSVPALAQRNAGAAEPAIRQVYLDGQGVVRWRGDHSEVRLFGANYVLPTASDYRAAGYVGADRKRMIDEDMAHFARMGWDGIRLTFWGDWEAADTLGNLRDNDHLDLLDYLVARARERGIYMLFSPIQLYNAKWPDALGDTNAPGFGRRYSRDEMGTNPAAIAAQVNYLRQILNHVNPYTGIALRDEPGIAFIELVNEPVHHSEDVEGSVRYINTLVEAVRSTGCDKLIFYNVSQDFRIGPAIVASKAQGVTFGWYPTGLNSGHELQGNYLRGVDAYPDMLRPELAGRPRIVYEFDSPDLRNATMYPAMVRTFRAVGTQFAAMFSYDMLRTASRNLGWQTHYLNLVYTPRKAMSAVIAAEAMRRLPRMKAYGAYPVNNRFGDFRLVPDSNLAVLAAPDVFMHAGTTSSVPPRPRQLVRVAGYGSSPVVQWDGLGTYFLDRIRPGLWRLEVYPDAVPVRDPFEPPSADKVVTRAVYRTTTMTITLPDLGPVFSVRSLTGEGSARAAGGRFAVSPGAFLLSTEEAASGNLPRFVGRLALAEFHAPPPDSGGLTVAPLTLPQHLADRDLLLTARVVSESRPDSVKLFLQRAAGDYYHGYGMMPSAPYAWTARVPADQLRPGPHDYVITVFRSDSTQTFPGPSAGQPWDWNYGGTDAWKLLVVDAATPLELFGAGRDAGRMAFTRIGDAGRRGVFRLGLSDATGNAVVRLSLPTGPSSVPLDDYTASMVVRDRIESREETIDAATGIRVRARGGAGQVLHLTLVEDDGTSWSTAMALDSAWTEPTIPLERFTVGRGVLLPQGFPGQWNYWVGPAAGRGGPGDRLRPGHIERLQLSLRKPDRPDDAAAGGVEVEWVRMAFGGSGP